jgi:PAS domain S-box-containing protein
VLAVLFERAPAIITITDRNGQQQTVNAYGLQLLGYDDSLRTPADGWSFVHPDDRAALTAHHLMLQERQERGDSLESAPPIRYRVKDGAGAWRWLETAFADMGDVAEVGARVAYSRDVTEFEERAQALLESQERLAALETLRDGDLVVDLPSHSVRQKGQPVSLSRLEWNLLVTFLRHPDQVLAADQLLRLAWGDPTGVGPERVKYSVLRLRRRLGWQDPTTSPIEAVRGLGYRYRSSKGLAVLGEDQVPPRR